MADATKACPACGEQILAVAKKCKHCGEVLDPTYQKGDSQRLAAPLQAAPARMESTIVQIAPDLENDKISEMEGFGWTLQGRQEIERTGDTKGEVTTNMWGENVYRQVTQVTRFVKLHFQRSSALPNLDEVKMLEHEYFALKWPEVSNRGCAGCLLVLGVFMSLVAVVNLPQLRGAESVLLALFWPAVFLGIGVPWWMSSGKRNHAVEEERRRLQARAAQLRMQARALLGA